MARGDVAVVTYLQSPLGEYLAGLMSSVAPGVPQRRPHITVLPRRPLPFSDQELLQRLREIVQKITPFHVGLGEVTTFLPISAVAYLTVSTGLSDLHAIHSSLVKAFDAEDDPEEFEFKPHLTLAYQLPSDEISKLTKSFREGWNRYQGPREHRVEQFTVVREIGPLQWADVGDAKLSGKR